MNDPSHEKSPLLANDEPVVPSVSTTKDLDTNWTKLSNLQRLYDEGFLTVTEFKERKSQLVDNLTGTSSRSTTASSTTGHRSHKHIRQEFVPPRAPNFTNVEPEHAIAYSFDTKTGEWNEQWIWVKIEKDPFAKGGLRRAYHLQYVGPCQSNSSNPDGFSKTDTYVAKISIDPKEDREVYFSDVEMQMYAREWSIKFNKFNPPKHVKFIKAAVLQLADRQGRPLCGVERFIAGPYHKHNNNYGFVSEDDRNTPQAFSHFTYEASSHSLLVCDIQGVGDMYTDPQVHTMDGIGCGKGNLGPRGFAKFLETHQCNAICKYFRLPSVNAKTEDYGTVPQNALATVQHITLHKYDVVQYNYHQSKIPPGALVSETTKEKKKQDTCCTIL